MKLHDTHVDLVREKIEEGSTVQDILQSFSEELNINVSLRTMKYFIAKHGIRKQNTDTPCTGDRITPHLDELKVLMRSGITYAAILTHLEKQYAISTSERHLRRILLKHGIMRQEKLPHELVVRMVAEESKTSGDTVGYRQMTQRLRSVYDVNISRASVSSAQETFDPIGKQRRQKKRLKRVQYSVPGVNYIWHIDGYDKLKRFGFPISGCIDGESKYVIWLTAAFSNSKPEITLSNYVKAVMDLNVMPTLTRTDYGSENPLVAAVQETFHPDQNEAHIYGPSTANQRIERWWGSMRMAGINFWIELFTTMERSGVYDYGCRFQLTCAQFVFGTLIQRDLDVIREAWNTHRIRKKPGTLGGVPFFVYQNPHPGKRHCGKHPPPHFLEAIQTNYTVLDLSNDPFGISPHVNALDACLKSNGIEEVNRDNMTRAFVILKNNHSLRQQVISTF